MISVTAMYNLNGSVSTAEVGRFPTKKEAIAKLQRFAKIRNSACMEEMRVPGKISLFTNPLLMNLRTVKVSNTVVGMRAGIILGWHAQRTGILRNPKVAKNYYNAFDETCGYVEFRFTSV